MRAPCLFAILAIVAGCGSADPASPGPSGPEPLKTALPLDASVGALSEAEVDAFCVEVGAWARRETQRIGVDAIRRGMCVNYGSFVGRSYPDRFLAVCTDEVERCVQTRIDPDAYTAIGTCALREGRAKCVAFPTVGQLVACYEQRHQTSANWWLSSSQKSCSDFATKGPVEPALEPACEVVRKACSSSSLY